MVPYHPHDDFREIRNVVMLMQRPHVAQKRLTVNTLPWSGRMGADLRLTL